MSTDKTLADVQPGGRVRLGDQAERARWRSMDTCPRDGTVVRLRWGEDHVSPGWWSAPVSPVQNDDGTWPSDTGGFPWAFIDFNNGSAFVNHAVDTEYRPTHWAPYAALSAQPSPGGQGEALVEEALDYFERAGDAGDRKYVAAIRAALTHAQILESQLKSAVEAAEIAQRRADRAARQPVYVQGCDELRARTESERAAYMEGLEEGKKIAARQPVGEDDQEYLESLDRALEGVIDQRDRYHEIADDLAGHIAAITGVDIGEHSSANCPWQNAIEAAEVYQPAQAVDLGGLCEMLESWKNSDYPFSYEGQCAQRALDACVADLKGWLDSQAVGK